MDLKRRRKILSFEDEGVSTTVIVLIAVIIAGASIGATAYILTRPKPNFQVKDLSVSRNKISQGEPVTAKVKVMNSGSAEGDYTIRLKIEGETLKKKVKLEAGESRTISFDIAKQEKGTYSLNIEDLSRTYQVVEPANFEVSNLKLSSTQVSSNEPIVASMVVSNKGDLSGEYTAKLEINGILENTETVTLDGGENATLSFRIQKKETRSYQVNISGLSKTFKVVPKYKLTNLEVNPVEVEPGENVSISVDVNNLSNEKVTYPISLNLDGTTEESKEVTVPGGESTTVTFTTNKQEKKTYSVEIDGLTSSFEVISPSKLKYEIKERNIVVREDRAPPGEWYTLVSHESSATTVDNLYIKFKPGQENQALNMLEHQKATVPNTKEELPYSFNMDAFEYYIYESPAIRARTLSGKDSGTIYLPTTNLFPKTGYNGSYVGGEEGYQILVTHEWAGVIIYSISSRKDSYFSFPSWFSQGFEEVIAEDFTYGKEDVLEAVESGDIPLLGANPYLWGMWAVYYLQCRFGENVPAKLVKSNASDFSQAFQNQTGLTTDRFISDFKSWMESNVDASLIEKVNETDGDYKAPVGT